MSTEVKENLLAPPFEKIDISTKTIIAHSNCEIDTALLFEKLPITKFSVVPKKRGRKRKEEKVDVNKNILPGSIITLKLGSNMRGVDLKPKKVSKNKTHWRNSMTVVMAIDVNKMINFKISKNGKFQLTGCKDDKHAEECIKYIWGYIFSLPNDGLYKIFGNELKIVFLTVMTNIDFNLGFMINRENLDEYINTKTSYNSLLETSFGYTGVNIKIPLKNQDDILLPTLYREGNQWKTGGMNYSEYLSNLENKEKEKIDKKQRYNTFLVFHSGNVIFSSMNKKFMEPIYNEFLNIIKNCRGKIEEKLDK